MQKKPHAKVANAGKPTEERNPCPKRTKTLQQLTSNHKPTNHRQPTTNKQYLKDFSSVGRVIQHALILKPTTKN